MQTDAERREIYDALEPVVGPRPATLIMDAMAPADALRSEMAQLRAELRGEMAELRGEMAELRGEMGELRGELRGEMAALSAKVSGTVPRLVLANVGLAFGTAGLVLAAANLG